MGDMFGEIDQNESVVYAGYSRRTFQSSDGMKTWQAIFDKELTLSIGCIAIDPANSNIVYVGWSDPNNGAYITAVMGIYKSTDGQKLEKLGLDECRNIAEWSWVKMIHLLFSLH